MERKTPTKNTNREPTSVLINSNKLDNIKPFGLKHNGQRNINIKIKLLDYLNIFCR